MSFRPLIAALLLAFPLACAGGPSATGSASDGTTEGTTGASAGSSSAGSTSVGTTDGSGSGSMSATDGGTASTTTTEGTSASTTGETTTDGGTTGPAPICGDQHIDPGEECDDGNAVDDDECTNGCQLPACGDGIVQDGEACDDGNLVVDDGCTNECVLPACGDGIVQDGETCDAGADNGPGKACKGDCQDNVCGDGDVGPGEGCDDGNMVDDDECTNACKLASCGDGKVQPGEACDDGNDSNNDACTNNCTPAACGDGFTQPPEDCDDADKNSDSAACTSECKKASCGDGLIQVGVEACDDGANNGPDKACKADCTKNVCGDGSKGPGEGCDDGNVISLDGCNSICQPELLCAGKLYECGNGFDDDNDGKVDLKDPECTSPCDDDEGSYQTSLPGQNKDCKADCYFDANSGQGDDQCVWNLKCDPKNPGADVGCPYDPNYKMCGLNMPQQCLDFCVPLVPNGCDCFGCCEIAGKYYYLDSGPDCSLDNLAGCNQCTFFPNCNNPCEPEMCEVCFGQDPNDLPPECGGKPKCDDNKVPCVDASECMEGEFCQTGCCTPIIPL
ncbi:MAG: DUF4215 domain-containing protein [Nannocystaceae bacterium]